MLCSDCVSCTHCVEHWVFWLWFFSCVLFSEPLEVFMCFQLLRLSFRVMIASNSCYSLIHERIRCFEWRSKSLRRADCAYGWISRKEPFLVSWRRIHIQKPLEPFNGREQRVDIITHKYISLSLSRCVIVFVLSTLEVAGHTSASLSLNEHILSMVVYRHLVEKNAKCPE